MTAKAGKLLTQQCRGLIEFLVGGQILITTSAGDIVGDQLAEQAGATWGIAAVGITHADEHSALAKSAVTLRMRKMVGPAREVFGGNGLLLENSVASYFADAEALYSYEGTREINQLIVGRAITGEGAFV